MEKYKKRVNKAREFAVQKLGSSNKKKTFKQKNRVIHEKNSRSPWINNVEVQTRDTGRFGEEQNVKIENPRS